MHMPVGDFKTASRHNGRFNRRVFPAHVEKLRARQLALESRGGNKRLRLEGESEMTMVCAPFHALMMGNLERRSRGVRVDRAFTLFPANQSPTCPSH
jgi:hypothetical protein